VKMLTRLSIDHGYPPILGHNEADVWTTKSCPVLDMGRVRKRVSIRCARDERDLMCA